MSRSVNFLRSTLPLLLCLAAAPLVALAAEFGASIVASPDRSADDTKNDAHRKPAELIDFTGVRPGWKVLDMVAGGGYTTELMARAVGGSGRVYAQTTADSPEKARNALKERMTKPVMANVEIAETTMDAPVPAKVHDLDLITLILNYHDVAWLPVDRPKMNKAMFDGLKKGGVLVIVDHAAKPGEGVTVAKSLHRIEEATVVKEVEAAGFKKVAEANFLRHPEDPKDKAFFQMDNQPTDQFVLKFVKP